MIDRDKLRKQKQIINLCRSKQLTLSEQLKKINWTYDDLQYEYSEFAPSSNYSLKKLSDYQEHQHDIPVISFFSGAGGCDLGFETAGFKHLALVEHNPIFCDTLRQNRPNWHVIGPPFADGDVSNFDKMVLQLDPVIGTCQFDGIFVGGPPCQPFSIAANQRFSKNGDNFKRVGFAHSENGNLLFDYLKLIIHYRPAAFFIENVTGLIDVDGGQQLSRAITLLRNNGYIIEDPIILNASRFCVPQYRERLFLIGNRLHKMFEPPQQSHNLIPCISVFSENVDFANNHITRKHSADSIYRYMKLNFGERDKLGRVDRLNPHLPSKTVIAGGTNGGGRSHLHPFIPRTISVREAARLQTFPDDYVFTGPVARQFTQVGNAVPPVLAAQIAKSIRSSFF
ncbi:MAG: DNA (cytosine-5-)-methyltransferase [Bacteroidia bacterium]|nr:DNA (cytosine-5-)-methyltransferase [Bacteroidia bacterium]